MGDEKDFLERYLFMKPAIVFIKMGDGDSIVSTHKKHDLSYSYTSKLFKKLFDEDILNYEIGKKYRKDVSMTKKGNKIKEYLLEIKKILDQTKNEKVRISKTV